MYNIGSKYQAASTDMDTDSQMDFNQRSLLDYQDDLKRKNSELAHDDGHMHMTSTLGMLDLSRVGTDDPDSTDTPTVTSFKEVETPIQPNGFWPSHSTN